VVQIKFSIFYFSNSKYILVSNKKKKNLTNKLAGLYFCTILDTSMGNHVAFRACSDDESLVLSVKAEYMARGGVAYCSSI
jgi:hypothetical protein